jgi:hypothetical protein
MLDDLFKKEIWDATPKIMKIPNYCYNTMYVGQEIATHKYWSVGIVVRSGGGPDNMLFDKSLHGKAECLESEYMYRFNKYFVRQWALQEDNFK